VVYFQGFSKTFKQCSSLRHVSLIS
jgi:hypothetical protein